jgi:hypothetical protein
MRVNILHITVRYQNATINRNTRKAEAEIEPNGSSQSQRNPQVDGYGYGFGPPRGCGSGLWSVLEPNQTVYSFQTRTAGGLPKPVANTMQERPKSNLLQSPSPSYRKIKLPRLSTTTLPTPRMVVL